MWLKTFFSSPPDTPHPAALQESHPTPPFTAPAPEPRQAARRFSPPRAAEEPLAQPPASPAESVGSVGTIYNLVSPLPAQQRQASRPAGGSGGGWAWRKASSSSGSKAPATPPAADRTPTSHGVVSDLPPPLPSTRRFGTQLRDADANAEDGDARGGAKLLAAVTPASLAGARAPDSLLAHAPSAGCPSPATPVLWPGLAPAADTPRAEVEEATTRAFAAAFGPSSPVDEAERPPVTPPAPPPLAAEEAAAAEVARVRTAEMPRRERLLRMGLTGRDTSAPTPPRPLRPAPGLFEDMEDWLEALQMLGLGLAAAALLAGCVALRIRLLAPSAPGALPFAPPTTEMLCRCPEPPPLPLPAPPPPMPTPAAAAPFSPMLIADASAELEAMAVVTTLEITDAIDFQPSGTEAAAAAAEAAAEAAAAPPAAEAAPEEVTFAGGDPSAAPLLWSFALSALLLARKWRRRAAAAAGAQESASAQAAEVEEEEEEEDGFPGTPAAAAPAEPHGGPLTGHRGARGGGFQTPAASRIISFAASPAAYHAPATGWRGAEEEAPAGGASVLRRSERLATATKAPATGGMEAAPPTSVLRRSERMARRTSMRGVAARPLAV